MSEIQASKNEERGEISHTSNKRQSNRIFSKKKKKQNIVTNFKNCKGVVITCSTADTSSCVKEFFNFLQSMEEVQQPQEERLDDLENEDIEESCKAYDNIAFAIENEKKKLKVESSRFLPFKNICKGVGFIRFDSLEDIPSQLTLRMFEHISKESTEFFFRYLCRILPLDVLCKPYPQEFTELAVKLVAERFYNSAAARRYSEELASKQEEKKERSEGKEGETSSTKQENVMLPPNHMNHSKQDFKTWSCSYTNRCMSTINRKLVLDVLAEAVGENYSVNLNYPDITIIVDVCPFFCGISIVKDFEKYKKFNISKVSLSKK